MQKLKEISEIVTIVSKLKKSGKKVGLITGCFDILHAGHIDLFTFAKKHVDVLVLGLDDDKSIKLSKGPTRPINRFKYRAEVLNEIHSIKYIFKIKNRFDVSTSMAHDFYDNIVKRVSPDMLITNPIADKYWTRKQERAKKMNIKLILQPIKRIPTSSTKILEKINELI